METPGKTYLVGGAVRDELLGVQVKDRDYVVVGATQEQMIAAGFSQVGESFPVFLHPTTGEEYALARTERKTGFGHTGFTFNTKAVTLEDDLARRDLTINAMAKDLVTGEIIDPFGGQLDLKAGVLRHVSSSFSEDPLRVLRVARFAARYNFTIAPATVELCKQLVAADEISHLSSQRIWKETERAFGEPYFYQYWKFLKEFGVLAKLGYKFHQQDSFCEPVIFKSAANKLKILSPVAKLAAFLIIFGGDDIKDLRVVLTNIGATNEAVSYTIACLSLWNACKQAHYENDMKLPNWSWFDIMIGHLAIKRPNYFLEVMSTVRLIGNFFMYDNWLPSNEIIASWIKVLAVDAAKIATENPDNIRDAILDARKKKFYEFLQTEKRSSNE